MVNAMMGADDDDYGDEYGDEAYVGREAEAAYDFM
jgi:hypothetical protein